MIIFKQVSKIYDNNHQALKNINLKIEQGEFVAIIGLSGAGKSTLLRTVNRMHEITSGQILVNDEDISKYKGKKLREYRHKIGMVFQSFNLVNRISVIKNVLVSKVTNKNFFSTLLGIYTKDEKIEALEALEKVGLLEKAFVRVDKLSGGQRQRVALARTLAQNPEIILADEPVASLDPLTAEKIMDDFKKINEELNITVLANMHHVDIALKYSSRVIGIKAGEIVYDGPSSDVNEAVLEKIYGRKLTQDELMEV